MRLDLCLSREDRLQVLNTVGQMIKSDKWFVVTDDGQCYLFDNNSKLDDISKITEICEWYIKRDIKRICIPNGVTSIGYGAFEDCIGLTSVMIPDSVTRIGYVAFYGCSDLMSIIFKGKTLEQVKAMNTYPWGIKDTSIIHVE